MFRFLKDLFDTPKKTAPHETAVDNKSDSNSILGSRVWAFNRKPYDSQSEFEEEITRYQKDILKAKAYWDSDETVINASEIDVCYEAWITSIDDLKSNEELIDDEEDLFDEDNADDGFFQVEISARLQAANGVSFTALDLMYQMEHQVSNKELGNHIFFEGFRQAQDYQGQFPLYHMLCGS